MALIYVVPQGYCLVIERFGKFARIQHAGLHFKLPFLEEIRRVDTWGEDICNKGGVFIELTEQQTDTQRRQCHTRDNVALSTNASVYWRIVDPRRALYEVDNLPRFVADVTLNALRARIGSLDLDVALSERQNLNEHIAKELSTTGQKWGVQFTRVEIQELQTSDETAAAMRQQMEAERKRRAAVAEADGQAYARVKVAQAEAEAVIIRAEAEAKSISIIAEAEAAYLARLMQSVTQEQAAQIVIAQKYLNGFNEITKNPSHKVFLPSSFKGLLSIDGH